MEEYPDYKRQEARETNDATKVWALSPDGSRWIEPLCEKWSQEHFRDVNKARH